MTFSSQDDRPVSASDRGTNLGWIKTSNPGAARPFAFPDLNRLALFLDVDGTLLDFAPRPDQVVVPPALTSALAALERKLDGALALISGRQIADLDRLFAPLRLAASGVHGGEMRADPQASQIELTDRPLSVRAWQELRRLLEAFPGTYAENKGVSFSIHYRDNVAVVEKLVLALGIFADAFAEEDVELVSGHLVFEVKHAGFDKGKAIRQLMRHAPFRGRIPLFLADDILDRPAFEMVSILGGAGFSVGSELPGVAGWFPASEAVRNWLRDLADQN